MGDFIVVSHPRGPVQAARARALRGDALHAGMAVMDIGDRVFVAVEGPAPPAILAVGAWRLIGEIHNRERRPLDPATELEPWSYERKLLSRFWGRFAGVLIGGDGDLKAVLRDPCGGLDCLAWEDEGLLLVASTLPPWLPPPRCWTLAYDRVGQVLQDGLLAWEHLLLDGPVSVRPGIVQPLPLDLPPVEIWSPSAIVRRGRTRPRTDDEAALALELAIDDVVRALARGPTGLAAEVSGGLDSSIVASSLARARPDVAPWINLRAAEAQSDERVYVGVLAERLGIEPLYVEHASGSLTDEDVASISTGIRPGLGGLDIHHGRDWASRLSSAGAVAVMTGRGGDSLLVQGATADVFADLWRDKGWRALFSDALVGLARLNDQSIWTLIARARRPAERRDRTCPLFTSAEVAVPIWLQDCADLGPAKRQQIAGLIDGIGRQPPSPQSRAVTVLTPLLSLPVVELCLELPTAQLVMGSRERGLARHAFRDRLPPEILERRTKGEMSATYGLKVADDLDMLRPYLLDGRLAAAGLIDRDAMDSALTRETLVWQGLYGRIMAAAAMEGWLRHWEARLERRP